MFRISLSGFCILHDLIVLWASEKGNILTARAQTEKEMRFETLKYLCKLNHPARFFQVMKFQQKAEISSKKGFLRTQHNLFVLN